MKIPLRLATLTLLASGLAADVAVFETTAPATGDVVVYDEAGVLPPLRPAALQAIQLLPLDFVGRTRLDALRPDVPRLRTDVPGAARVLLPAGRGSLYRYRRDDVAGSVFGYFQVGADGAPSILWERPGTGVLGADDPIATRVAIDPTGEAFLVGTTLAAGGDLVEVTPAGVIDRTPTLGPLAFAIGGVTLLSEWGVGVTATALVRFSRDVGSFASAVGFPGGVTPAFFEGSPVASANGNRMAFVAGGGPTSAHVWVIGANGNARRVTASPAHLSGAGFLPEHASGPTLALSPDGTTCAWRQEGVTRESFVKLVQAPNQPGFQITADERFADTLDDTGVLGFLSLTTLILIVGEQDRAGTGAIEGADFYRLELGGNARFVGGVGAASLNNLSGTSGDLLAPFLAQGEIDTDVGLLRIPGTQSILVPLEGSSGQGSLHRLDLGLGTFETLLNDVREVELVQSAGSHLLLALRRNFADDRRELVSLPASSGSVPTVLATLPEDTEFGRCDSRADGTVALVANLGVDEWAGRIHLPTGASALFSGSPRTYGPVLGFTPAGSLAVPILFPNGSTAFVLWHASGARALFGPLVPGFLLPGA